MRLGGGYWTQPIPIHRQGEVESRKAVTYHRHLTLVATSDEWWQHENVETDTTSNTEKTETRTH